MLDPDPTRQTPTMTRKRKLVIVGAGPVGCLAAISFAKMGWSVEIYEARPGILVPSPSEFSAFSRKSQR
jgi:2-polyprenyl-6-methoxyphenol hydroxylase-like FAD-dependent oxidoreductase